MHQSIPTFIQDTNSTASSVVIIGLGPRGASLLERIAARNNRPRTVHLVDDAPSGAGRIWRTDQDPDMCMNTLAGAVTLFTDSSFTGAGPVVPGPSLHEWCQWVAGFAAGEIAEYTSSANCPAHPGDPSPVIDPQEELGEVLADPRVSAEILRVTSGSHPSRALYGHYSRWVFRTSLQRLAPDVRVMTHRTRAVAIRALGAGRTCVELADGTMVIADSVALAPGWLPSEPSRKDQELARRTAGKDVIWIGPDSPIQQDLSAINAGENVIVRGLGMGFFDSLSMLTIGRGGHFQEAPGNRLRYVASGQEPVVHVGSRRGLPFLAKSVYNGLPPKPRLTRVRRAEQRGLSVPLRFLAEIWPHLVRDANEAFYATLAHTRTLNLTAVLQTIDADDLDSLPTRIRPLLPGDIEPLDVPALFHQRVAATTHAEYQSILRGLVEADLTEANAGLLSPLKAALWELNGARRWVMETAAFDGADAVEYGGDLAEFLSFGGLIGSGPPAFRSRQLLALMDAGLVHFIGPEISVDVTDDAFTAHSPVIIGSRVTARVLLDAWVRLHDARRSTDPLIQQLVADGLAEPFARLGPVGSRTPGPSLRIDELTSELIGPAGRHGIHLLGVPSDVVRGNTIIAPMPGTDPTMLREVDACVEAMLSGPQGLSRSCAPSPPRAAWQRDR